MPKKAVSIKPSKGGKKPTRQLSIMLKELKIADIQIGNRHRRDMGEYAENEIRKDFTPSERVAIAKAIEQKVGNRQGQRTDKQLVGQIPQVAPGKKTREIAAEKAGFGNDKTYRQAAKVVENGTPSRSGWGRSWIARLPLGDLVWTVNESFTVRRWAWGVAGWQAPGQVVQCGLGLSYTYLLS